MHSQEQPNSNFIPVRYYCNIMQHSSTNFLDKLLN
uniref:Uncharacterized protein n=1 Tax=Arundo donax TaxID=35708 RepID=A0A0A9CEW9_ARUDO